MKISQPSWATCFHAPSCPQGKNISFCSGETSCVSVCVHYILVHIRGKSLDLLSLHPPFRSMENSPKTSRLSSLSSLSLFLLWEIFHSLYHLSGFPSDSISKMYISLLYWISQNWTWCPLPYQGEGKYHLPQSVVNCPPNPFQDTANLVWGKSTLLTYVQFGVHQDLNIFFSELGWISPKLLCSAIVGWQESLPPDLGETAGCGARVLGIAQMLWRDIVKASDTQNVLGKAWRWEEWDGLVWIGEKKVLEDRSNCMFIGNFRLEMISGGSLHNYLLKAASLRRPHHVAQGFFKSGIEYLQGGNISQSLGSLCHSGLFSDEKKIVLLYVQSESVLFQHLPTASSLLLKVWPCLPNVQGYR